MQKESVKSDEHRRHYIYKHQDLAEAFTDHTPLFMKRTEKNLRFATKYLSNFHLFLFLACNLDKTHIISIGEKNNIDMVPCPHQGMKW